MHRATRLALATLLLSTLTALAQQSTTAPSLDDPRMEALIKQLAAPSFEEREKAQRELDAIPPGKKAALEQWAKRLNDEEIHERLYGRIGRMNLELLPSLKLHVENAAIGDLADTLAKQLDVAITASEGGITKFSMNENALSLGDALIRLSATRPLWLSEHGFRFRLSDSKIKKMVAQPGVVVGIEDAKRDLKIPQFEGQATIPLVMIYARVLIDPRLPVLEIGNFLVADAIDNEGQRWQRTNTRRIPSNRFTMNPEIAFEIPAKAGKKISFSGEVRFTIAIEQVTTVIENITQHAGEPFKFAGNTLIFRGIQGKKGETLTALHLEILPDGATEVPQLPIFTFDKEGFSHDPGIGTNKFGAVIVSYEGGGGMFSGATDIRKTTFFRVTDSKGTRVASYALGGGTAISNLHVFSTLYEEPLKLELRTTTKSREIRVPFEFKDIDVP